LLLKYLDLQAKVLMIYVQFRAAIRLRFDFHRAVYNLGTVLVRPGSSGKLVLQPPLKPCKCPANPTVISLW
jgi:hypothetical protein